jgi:hypothetical protein
MVGGWRSFTLTLKKHVMLGSFASRKLFVVVPVGNSDPDGRPLVCSTVQVPVSVGGQNLQTPGVPAPGVLF